MIFRAEKTLSAWIPGGFGEKMRKGGRFHDLRHTFNAVMLQNGADPKMLVLIRRVPGQTPASFTLDVYSYGSGQMQQASDKMDSLCRESYDKCWQDTIDTPF